MILSSPSKMIFSPLLITLKPTITQWTAAFPFASLTHLKVRYAKSMLIPNISNNGFHTAATCSPCVIEFVETNAARIAVPCKYSAAL
jgi:hypothetical protein